MKKMIPDALGMVGVALFVGGVYLRSGLADALLVGGGLLILGGFLAARRVAVAP